MTNIELDPGSYSLSEVTIPAYEKIDLSCTGTSDNNLDNGLTLSNGEIVTCTFTNTDIPASLNIFVDIINDDGGKAEASDWELQVNGPAIVNSRPNSNFYALFSVPAGTYTLKAINGPDNYKIVNWRCFGGDLLNENELTLDIGSHVSCTVIIDDQQIQAIPTLSLAGLLGLIASFATFFGWRQRSIQNKLQRN